MRINNKLLILFNFSLVLPMIGMEMEQDKVQIDGVGVAHNQGRRKTMEDRDSINLSFAGEPDDALFGIYDGHGGVKIADYVATKLPDVILYIHKTGRHPAGNLSKAFAYIDANLKTSDVAEDAKYSGTTSIVVFKVGNKIYAANVGDSRAILSRGGKAIALSIDHKPDRPDEKKRIEDLGGEVVIVHGVARVQGNLAMSRAIGDYSLSPYVISTPEIKEEKLRPYEDQFLLLACDGIFEADIINNQQAVDIVSASLRKNRGNPDRFKIAAEELVQAAYDKGSGDNLSVIVVGLKVAEKIEKQVIVEKPLVEKPIVEEPVVIVPKPFPLPEVIVDVPERTLSKSDVDQLTDELVGYAEALPSNTNIQDVLFVKQSLYEIKNLLKQKITKNLLTVLMGKLQHIKNFIAESEEADFKFASALYGELNLEQFREIAIDTLLKHLERLESIFTKKEISPDLINKLTEEVKNYLEVLSNASIQHESEEGDIAFITELSVISNSLQEIFKSLKRPMINKANLEEAIEKLNKIKESIEKSSLKNKQFATPLYDKLTFKQFSDELLVLLIRHFKSAIE